MPDPQVTCTGRAYDDHGNPTTDLCGTPATTDLATLRDLGWKIGPPDAAGHRPAMCPRCAAPDPALVRLCSTLRTPKPAPPATTARPDTETLPGL